MFIQIHCLTSHVAVLLNRDDSGLSKRIPFGGAVRTRVSSQSTKRKLRTSTSPNTLAEIGEMSVRSRDIFKKMIGAPLVAEGFETADVVPTVAGLRDVMFNAGSEARRDAVTDIRNAAETDDPLSALRQNAPVILGYKEIENALAITREVLPQISGASEPYQAALTAMRPYKKTLFKMREGASIDVAMFGRFVTGDPHANIDAAIHVAHAFSVHKQATEIDLFSCVDDLSHEDNGGGAAHIDETEVNSPLLYQYVVIDVAELVGNIYGVAPENWREVEDTTAAREAIRRLVNLLATDVVGAKKGSTAPYSSADLVMLEVGRTQPRTLANSYQRPVKPDSEIAAQALYKHMAAKDRMFGVTTERFLATCCEGETPIQPVTVDEAAINAANAAFA